MISQQEFYQLNRVFEDKTGIKLSNTKCDLMSNRLASRLRAHNFKSYHQYYQLITSSSGVKELAIFIDKLTTHETYFFRENGQFEFLYDYLKRNKNLRPISALSAAVASGEEAYSMAMILDDVCGPEQWQITGIDISLTAIENAKNALYALATASKIPSQYRRHYCLKGIGEHEGSFTLIERLKKACKFKVDNLVSPSFYSQFDVIFLRNVLIYFTSDKQKVIVNHMVERLNQNGLLFLGHSESLLRKHPKLDNIAPCIYQRKS